MNTTPFYANLGYHPSFNITPTTDMNNPSAEELATQLDHIHQELRAELAHLNEEMAKQYSWKQLPAPEYSVGDFVFLWWNTKTTWLSEKLDIWKLGPFEILEKQGWSVYLFKLPPSFSCYHPVFNIDLLEPYIEPSTTDRWLLPPLVHVQIKPEMGLRDAKKLDVWKLGWQLEYFVKWQGLEDDENSWVALSAQSSDKLLETYHRWHPKSIHPPQFTFAQEQTSQSDETLSNTFTSDVQESWISSWEPLTQTTLHSGWISWPWILEGG